MTPQKKIKGKGNIDLNMTSGKILPLKDMLLMPCVRINLISGSLLLKLDFQIILESNKVVITKNNVFAGKGFIDEGLFKSNIFTQTC